MDKVRPKVAKAFNVFDKILARSTQKLDGADIDLQRSDSLLQKKIDEREKDCQRSIVASYSRFQNPFRVLGKNSREAQSIEEDKQNLLKAYKLFKVIKEANQKIGDGETFLNVVDLKSPLTQKLRYTSGDDFIYLQCWLIYENGIRDYVPSLVEVEDRLETGYKLEFVPFRRYEFSWNEKEVIAAIEDAFQVHA